MRRQCSKGEVLSLGSWHGWGCHSLGWGSRRRGSVAGKGDEFSLNIQSVRYQLDIKVEMSKQADGLKLGSRIWDEEKDLGDISM